MSQHISASGGIIDNADIKHGHDEKRMRLLVSWAYGLCFFPSLFYVLIPNQTQPFYALFAAPLLLLRPLRVTRLTFPFLLLIGLIAVWMLVTLFLYPEIAGEIISNGISYIVPLILFLALYDKTEYLTPGPLMLALVVWVLVGMLQAFPFPDAIKSASEVIGRLMFERFIAGASSDTRGYGLLASEPSLSAPTLALMVLSVHFFYRERKFSRLQAASCYAATLFLIVLNRSGTIGILLITMLLGMAINAFYRASGAQRALVLVWMLVALVGGGIFLSNYDDKGKNIRSLEVAKAGFDYAVDAASGQPKIDPMVLLVTVANQRVIPDVLAFGSIFQNFGVGHGVASWRVPEVTESVKKYVGIRHEDFINIGGIRDDMLFYLQEKPQSYAALIAYDTGFWGLLIFGWSTWVVFAYRGPASAPRPARMIYLLPGFLWLTVMATSTMPAPWVMYLYAIHVARFPRPSAPKIFAKLASVS